MNIRDLEYIIAVSEEQHFGKAAKKCNVSQPALSGQIRKLEDYIGVTLFERTSRSVKTTAIGEDIIVKAKQLVSLSDEIFDMAQNSKDPLSGPFKLGMITTIAPYLSPLILSSIRQQLPKVSLTLVEGLTTDLEKAVAEGELDGAITATSPIPTQLNDNPLYDEPFWIALPKFHKLASRRSIDLSEIDPKELLLLADGHCLRDQILDICHTNEGINHTNTRQTSLGTLLALVEAGDGVTLVPALTKPAANNAHGTIVICPERSGTAGRRVRLISRASFPRTELLNNLASTIRTNLPTDLVQIVG
ncbi:MAG: LysR substrate-binding domain-containing protein [Sneathiella sp.]